MTVDFFVLPTQDNASYFQFLQAQIQLYYCDNKTLMIYAEHELCSKLDELLWFNQTHIFIPHFFINKPSVKYANLPVLLTNQHSLLNEFKKNILLDLTMYKPFYLGKFANLVRIFDQSSSRLEAARFYYKQCQKAGVLTKIHKL